VFVALFVKQGQQLCLVVVRQITLKLSPSKH
jgi:hypothetical protein